MSRANRQLLGRAIFFGGGFLVWAVFGSEAVAGYGWAIIMGLIARTIID